VEVKSERPMLEAANLTAVCEQLSRQCKRSSTSHNFTGLHGLLQGQKLKPTNSMALSPPANYAD
jgi:hypothetical protein